MSILRGSLMFAMLLLPACSTPNVIPPELEPQVDQSLAFHEILQDPETHKGKLMLIGGEVLDAKGLKEGTQLEILQLPLDEWQRPVDRRLSSKGRFLALHETYLDPATIPQRMQVTLVGEITGSKLAPLDETEYRYPTFIIKHLHLWERDEYHSPRNAQPRWSIFGAGGTGMRTGGGVGIGIGF